MVSDHDATLYGELKLPFFRNDELCLKTGYIDERRLNKKCLYITVNDVACKLFVHSVSIVGISIFC